MTFAVAADDYDRFMGRYSTRLAPVFADFAVVESDARVLDVGCGPGALTTELVRRVGAEKVTAVDPSESFVLAARERHPGVTVAEATAEKLPFPDASFDQALAQLVVQFMADPVGGLREMARVLHPGGRVAACVWDHAGDGGPLSPFWSVARGVDPTVVDESRLAGVRAGHLTELFAAAGLRGLHEQAIEVELEHATFEQWWEPYTLGVGPAGSFVAQLTPDQRREVELGCRALYPTEPFTVNARAWACSGRAGAA